MVGRYQKIIVPLDGSAWSEAVLPNAIDVARTYGSELILLHVQPVPLPEFIDPIEVVTSEDSTHAEALHQRFSQLVDQLGDDGAVQMRFAVITGSNIAQAIKDYIVSQEVDLVIMASHGRTGLRRLMLGSVTQEVMQAVDIPIMVIRPGRDISL